jgi:hypothetical protein
VDTKKDLLEICGNLAHTSEHQRLVREVELRYSLSAKNFIFLIGEKDVKTIDDIKKWTNKHTKISGETLYKIMVSFSEHHHCRFIIVPKKEMGAKIIELLGGKNG